MNLITQTFTQTKEQNRAALITFITAGVPDFATSLAAMHALAASGADIIELGMPFSDPVADGAIIQQANLCALSGNQTLAQTLKLVQDFRQTNSKTPIVLMGYFNPIHYFGVDKFIKDAKTVGVNGLLVVDLPPEHHKDLYQPAQDAGLAGIRLVTPTTDAARLPFILKNSCGFIYYVAVAGITGGASGDLAQIAEKVKQIKQQTNLAVAVGFGIKTPMQAAQIAKIADGVVVGSALVELTLNSAKNELEPKISTLCADLAASLSKN